MPFQANLSDFVLRPIQSLSDDIEPQTAAD
jgi:hypothetical protein